MHARGTAAGGRPGGDWQQYLANPLDEIKAELRALSERIANLESRKV
ncbi:hypothetical protein AB0C10_31130 [Microbispora amethystogenes]